MVAAGALLLASVTVSAAGDGDAGLTGADGDAIAAHTEPGSTFGTDAEVARTADAGSAIDEPAIDEPAIGEVMVEITPLDPLALAQYEVTVSNETAEPVERVVVVFDDEGVALVEPESPDPLLESETLPGEPSVVVAAAEPGRFEIPLIPGTDSVTFVVAGPERALSGDDGPLVAEIGGFQRPNADTDADPAPEDSAPEDSVDAPTTDGDIDLAASDPTYSIGDLVWLDADDDGKIGADEEPIGIVRLELFADVDADGVADDVDADGSITSNDALAVTATGADGTYAFTGLDAGEYVVGIPPSEWGPGRSLAGLMSSTPVPIGSLRNVDDIGDVCSCGYVMSGAVAVGVAPAGDASGALDQREDLSVDFGFWRPALELGITVDLAEGTPSQSEPGSIVTLVLIITNLGNVAAADIEIAHVLPDSATLDDAVWAEQADGSVRATIAGDSLAPGESTVITLQARLSSSASGSLRNEATITGARPVDADGFALRLPPGELVLLTPAPAASELAIVVAQGSPTPTLPATGTTSGLLAAAGLALLLLGVGIVTVSSRVLMPSVARCSDEHVTS